MRKRLSWRRVAANVMVGASLLIVATASVAIGSRAYAVYESVIETGTPGFLVLRSDPGTPQWEHLEPGDELSWLVEVSLTGADAGQLRLEIDAEGDLLAAADMDVAVSTCDAPFEAPESLAEPNATPPSCAGTMTTVVTRQSLAQIAADGFDLVELPALMQEQPQELLVRLFLAEDADADAVGQSRASIGIGLHGEGDDADAPGPAVPPLLGSTGADVAAALWLAAGLIALGLSVFARRRAVDEVTA